MNRRFWMHRAALISLLAVLLCHCNAVAQLSNISFAIDHEIRGVAFGGPLGCDVSSDPLYEVDRMVTDSSGLKGQDVLSDACDCLRNDNDEHTSGSSTSSVKWNFNQDSGFFAWYGQAQNDGGTVSAQIYARLNSVTMSANVAGFAPVSVLKPGGREIVNPLSNNWTLFSINSPVSAHVGFENDGVDSNRTVILYSVGDAPLLGELPDNPLPSGPSGGGCTAGDAGCVDTTTIIDENFDEDEPIERSSNITGSSLRSTTAVPVVENDYGHANTVYIDPALAIGYGYTLQGTNRFRTFEIPAPLPQGDDQFAIHYLGQSYPLTAGQVFDFTTLDPAGVDSFLLLGIDEAELIDPAGNAHPPFVYGATFIEAGIAEVTTFPLVAVPEPGALALAALAVLAVAAGPLRSPR